MLHKFLNSLMLAILLITTTQCATSNANEITYPTDYEAPLSDKMVEKNMKLNSAFTSILVEAGIKVYYTIGRQNTMKIVGPQNQIDKMTTNISNNCLYLTIKNRGTIRQNDCNEVKVYINAPMFNSASLSSGGVIELQSAVKLSTDMRISSSSGGIFENKQSFTCKNLKIDGSSGCIINIHNLTAVKTTLDVSSGGIVTVNGETEMMNVDASSGAIVTVSDLASDNGSIDASSGAIVTCRGNHLSIDKSSGAIVSRKN